MVNHEKIAFLKFFITYFVSVALLILAAGFFYFQQMSLELLKSEHFSLLEYARHIKMDEDLSGFSKDYHHGYALRKQHLSISNFRQTQYEFVKELPVKNSLEYLQVFKSKKEYEAKLLELKERIIGIQFLLLSLFAFLSFILARSALEPLKKSVHTLEKFTKDLIHDLNTPVTAMKLNLRILEKNDNCLENKAFQRLQKSVDTVSELHLSLTTLLENKTFQNEEFDICPLVSDVVDLHIVDYPDINLINNCNTLTIRANKSAIKQVLQNLLSNACKYNKKNGYVKIYTKNKQLFIEDSGLGISDKKQVFQREYSGHNSTGLGLDIVKRLCDAMGIEIEIESLKNGSCFILTLR